MGDISHHSGLTSSTFELHRPEKMHAMSSNSYLIPLILLFVLLPNVPTGAQQVVWDGYRTAPPLPSAVSSSPSGQPQGNGQPDFLLLRTGFLLEGIATLDGKHYSVKTEFGGVQIPVANVEFIGRSRHEVYLVRRNLVDGNNCQELMRFAEWCSNNGLIDEAVEEYARARQVVPNSSLDSTILRQIEFLQQQIEDPNETTPTTSSRTGLSTAGAADSDGADFNRLVSGMPKSIADTFQKKVQPTLTNRCAATDCHGSSSNNGFKVGIPRQPNGVTMYQNLQSSLRWIDPANPSASPLLTAMVTPHGNGKQLFNVESKQYIETVQWIQATLKDLPPEYTDRLSLLTKNETPTVQRSSPPEVPSTFFTDADQVTVVPTLPPSPSSPTPPETKVAAAIDSLDPALFNTRFHGR